MEGTGEQKGQRRNVNTWVVEKESKVSGDNKTLVGGWLWFEIVFSGSSCSAEWVGVSVQPVPGRT